MTSRQVSRDELRGLYAKTQEEERLRKVKEVVNNTYAQVVRQASASVETTFIFHYALGHNPSYKDFNTTNILDIVAGLKELFPDSTITERSILRLHNGTMHDISTLDPKFIGLLGPGQQIQALVIDWT